MAFRAFALGNNGGTSTVATCAITVPGTAVAGDVAVVFLSNNLGASGTFTPPASDGWTSRVGPDSINSNMLGQIYTKTLVSGDIGASKTFTSSTAGRFTGVMSVLSGVLETPNVVSAVLGTTTAATTVNTPSVTTTVALSNVLQFLALRSGTTTASTATVPTNWTTAGASVQGTQSAAPAFSSNAFYLTTPGAAGSYGGENVTTSLSSTALAYTIAFAPANVFSGSLTVTGVGSTSFSATTHMQSGAFPGAGVGTLALGATPVVSGALAVTGSGSTSFGGVPGGVASLAVSGVGSLALSGAPRAGGTLAVTGTGTLTFATTSGTGTLAVSGVGTTVFGALPAMKGTLAATGVGTLLLVGKLLASGTFTVTGSGTLAFTGRAITRHSWWDGTTWRTIVPQVWGGATLGWLTIPVTISAVGSFA